MLRRPLDLHDKRSQCQVRTHHCSAASDCGQVDHSFRFSLEGEGNRLAYDFFLALRVKLCSAQLLFLLSFHTMRTLIKAPSIVIPSQATRALFFLEFETELNEIRMEVNRFTLTVAT